MAQNTQFMWRAAAAEAALSDASSNCEALAHALDLLKKHAAAEQSAAAKQLTANAQKIEALEKSVTNLQAEVVTVVSKLRDQQAQTQIREQPQLLTPALRVARPDLSSSSSGVAKPVNAASPTLKPPAASTSPAPVIVASGATKLAVAADSSGSQLAAAPSSSSPPASALSATKVSLATSSDQPVSVLRGAKPAATPSKPPVTPELEAVHGVLPVQASVARDSVLPVAAQIASSRAALLPSPKALTPSPSVQAEKPSLLARLRLLPGYISTPESVYQAFPSLSRPV